MALAVILHLPARHGLDTPHHRGLGPGDHLAFLWNDWWATRRRRRVVWSHLFFHTTRLFAPFGAPLVLNTHTALESLVRRSRSARVPVVRAHNLLVLAGLAANGFAAYPLVWRSARRVDARRSSRARRSPPAAYVQRAPPGPHQSRSTPGSCRSPPDVDPLRRTPGRRERSASRSPSRRRSGRTTTTSSTPASSACVCAVTSASARDVDPRTLQDLRRSRRRSRRARSTRWRSRLECHWDRRSAGPMHVSALHARNPMSIAGVCALAGCCCICRIPHRDRRAAWPRLATPCRRRGDLPRPRLRQCRLAAARLIGSGDYVSQQYFWRSAPRGVDLATVGSQDRRCTPSPAGYTTAALRRLSIDLVEQTAWLGLSRPCCPSGDARPLRRSGVTGAAGSGSAPCSACGRSVPRLASAGRTRECCCRSRWPASYRSSPNARIPGRAFVMVQLA